VQYAEKYYVTILPEQQAFGHLHHALKYEIYSDLAETPHGHVLTPTKEKSYDFIRASTRNWCRYSPVLSYISAVMKRSNLAAVKRKRWPIKLDWAACTWNICGRCTTSCSRITSS